MRLIRRLWAWPASLPGLLLALPMALGGATIRRREGTLEVCGGCFGRLAGRLPLACRFDAITLGQVILARDEEVLSACRAHERVHVRQYERWGLLFYPLYLGASLWLWLRGGRPYLDNPFEREARALS